MSPSCDEWRSCTRVLGGYRPLGRVSVSIMPNRRIAFDANSESTHAYSCDEGSNENARFEFT
jgi:hypothetical protein